MGGHGGLNILPQKSWNVYNYDNREQVRKDEEEEAQRLQQDKEQQLRVEAELRHSKLLENAQAKRRGDPELDERKATSLVSSGRSESQGHINLFEGLVPDGNKLGEEVKGSRKIGKVEAADRKGKLGGMGMGAEDVRYSLGHCVTGHNPWYTQPLAGHPLGHKETRRSHKHKALYSIALSTEGADKVEASKPRKRKRTMEELRAERLQREQHERDRARKVLVGQIAAASKGDGLSGSASNPRGQVPQRYNSGFGNARR